MGTILEPLSEPLVVSIKEAARLLSLSRFTVRLYAVQGLIKSVRLGKRIVIPLEEVRRVAREGVKTPKSLQQAQDKS
jgi:excisionase family DNA binding protein